MIFFLLLFVTSQGFLTVNAKNGMENGCDWTPFWTEKERQQWNDMYIKDGLKADISEDVVPMTNFIVKYENDTIIIGEPVSSSQMGSPPKVSWLCDSRKYYDMMLLEISLQRNNVVNQAVNWEVEGITDCNMDMGTTKTPYSPPMSAPNSGSSLQMFLMFERSTNTTPNPVQKETVGSDEFSLDEYIKNRGCPWAGTFFRLGATTPIDGDDAAISLGARNLVPVDILDSPGPVNL